MGQSWPRGTGSVGDSVGEGYYSVIHIAVLLQCETPSSADARSGPHPLAHMRRSGPHARTDFVRTDFYLPLLTLYMYMYMYMYMYVYVNSSESTGARGLCSIRAYNTGAEVVLDCSSHSDHVALAIHHTQVRGAGVFVRLASPRLPQQTRKVPRCHRGLERRLWSHDTRSSQEMQEMTRDT